MGTTGNQASTLRALRRWLLLRRQQDQAASRLDDNSNGNLAGAANARKDTLLARARHLAADAANAWQNFSVKKVRVALVYCWLQRLSTVDPTFAFGDWITPPRIPDSNASAVVVCTTHWHEQAIHSIPMFRPPDADMLWLRVDPTSIPVHPDDTGARGTLIGKGDASDGGWHLRAASMYSNLDRGNGRQGHVPGQGGVSDIRDTAAALYRVGTDASLARTLSGVALSTPGGTARGGTGAGSDNGRPVGGGATSRTGRSGASHNRDSQSESSESDIFDDLGSDSDSDEVIHDERLDEKLDRYGPGRLFDSG